MRIDYVLISKDLETRLKSAEILGKYSDRIGFFGSDHSPISMELHPSEHSGNGKKPRIDN